MAVPSLDEQVRRAAAERADREESDGRLLVLTGLPLAFLGWAFLTGALWLPQFMFFSVLPWGPVIAFWIALAVATCVVVIDAYRNVAMFRERRVRLEEAGRPGFFTSGISRFAAPATDAFDDSHAPLVIFVLSFTRNACSGFAKLALARRLRDPGLIDSATRFVAWLGDAPEPTLRAAADWVAANPSWTRGAALALDLGLVRVDQALGAEPTLRVTKRAGV